MKKAWKWILGILLVLVVIAAFIVVPLVLHSVYGYGFYDRGFGMMGGRGFMPFFGGFMMIGMGLRWLVPLALIGLLGYGAYRLGQRKAAPVVTPAPAPAAPEQTCPKCGQPVQAGWNNCANCGKKL